MLQRFIRFPEFTEFNQSCALFWKKSNSFGKVDVNKNSQQLIQVEYYGTAASLGCFLEAEVPDIDSG